MVPLTPLGIQGLVDVQPASKVWRPAISRIGQQGRQIRGEHAVWTAGRIAACRFALLGLHRLQPAAPVLEGGRSVFRCAVSQEVSQTFRHALQPGVKLCDQLCVKEPLGKPEHKACCER